jgi:hypothetical protein
MDFIESIAAKTYDFAQQQGGSLPYSVIREIAENFIHAHFLECTVSILNSGNTIHFSDQGPGIEKKHLVQQPGITSATATMKRFIRGVGSGFPLVKEYLEYRNGFLTINDNAQDGTVVTLSIQPDERPKVSPAPPPAAGPATEAFPITGEKPEPTPLATAPPTPAATTAATTPPAATAQPRVSPDRGIDKRSLHVLHLLYEEGILGPSDLTGPLEVSAATAHRILVGLEQKGLIESTPHRKRILSSAGLAYLESEAKRRQGG